MGKKVTSLNIEEYLADAVETAAETIGMSRSKFISEVLKENLDMESILQRKLEGKKEELDRLRTEKQRIEKDIWGLEDEIEDLKDTISERRSVKKVMDSLKGCGLDGAVGKVSKWVEISKKVDSLEGRRYSSVSEVVDEQVDWLVEVSGYGRDEVRRVFSLLFPSLDR